MQWSAAVRSSLTSCDWVTRFVEIGFYFVRPSSSSSQPSATRLSSAEVRPPAPSRDETQRIPGGKANRESSSLVSLYSRLLVAAEVRRRLAGWYVGGQIFAAALKSCTTGRLTYRRSSELNVSCCNLSTTTNACSPSSANRSPSKTFIPLFLNSALN